ncbi:hypothetical protein JANAI62_08240 [Jannaschia pagri]|uniref:DUF2254 domain-containing protein n=1 Tax=Jannaschia pagri TaxID=2829797 RepID=A0ABQ4NIN8_9RHOB|nr:MULTISPECIES: DUF2254 domain-containing protein [unclassified Jannaschia]GIT89691.1 hypothetical protein JANAI61_01490 [Jannaschia sp. AI_61]GIT94201.1 hypothetical protein JANAI62_08240 [Jannaschia sp. AI_62]
MILSAALWRLRQLSRDIWVRIVLMLALACLTVAIAPVISGLLPRAVSDRIQEEDVTDLLSILTGTMLAVATFSLSVMVSAHHYASNQVTPRSHRLLRQDSRTQSALATFIGAFVFALAGRIMLTTGLYDGRDFAAVYGATILVIGLVIVALVRWVQHISALGSMEQTTDRVEAAARSAMGDRMDLPLLGARPRERDADLTDAIPIKASGFGWVQHIDMPALSAQAEAIGGEIHLSVLPGDRVDPETELMRVAAPRISTQQQTALAEAITTGTRRSFDQDPAFGLEVLAEIGQRALSPGLNDPRTATDVIYRILSVLSLWSQTAKEEAAAFPRVRAPAMSVDVLLVGSYDAIARDGAAFVEVQLALQEALTTLSRHRDADLAQAARKLSARCLLRSDRQLALAEDAARVRDRAPGAVGYSAASR